MAIDGNYNVVQNEVKPLSFDELMKPLLYADQYAEQAERRLAKQKEEGEKQLAFQVDLGNRAYAHEKDMHSIRSGLMDKAQPYMNYSYQNVRAFLDANKKEDGSWDTSNDALKAELDKVSKAYTDYESVVRDLTNGNVNVMNIQRLYEPNRLLHETDQALSSASASRLGQSQASQHGATVSAGVNKTGWSNDSFNDNPTFYREVVKHAGNTGTLFTDYAQTYKAPPQISYGGGYGGGGYSRSYSGGGYDNGSNKVNSSALFLNTKKFDGLKSARGFQRVTVAPSTYENGGVSFPFQSLIDVFPGEYVVAPAEANKERKDKAAGKPVGAEPAGMGNTAIMVEVVRPSNGGAYETDLNKMSIYVRINANEKGMILYRKTGTKLGQPIYERVYHTTSKNAPPADARKVHIDHFGTGLQDILLNAIGASTAVDPGYRDEYAKNNAKSTSN